ncbi:hypothetical protein ETN89_09620 [Photobacterium damselae subsp. damselae]|nr:hypothetical protein ETN89_09620 [Photobacterium damselae subsp. damselae]
MRKFIKGKPRLKVLFFYPLRYFIHAVFCFASHQHRYKYKIKTYS